MSNFTPVNLADSFKTALIKTDWSLNWLKKIWISLNLFLKLKYQKSFYRETPGPDGFIVTPIKTLRNDIYTNTFT